MIGAGVVGVATAYELATLEHEVTVFERRSSVATEGSYALAGLLADCSPLPGTLAGLRLSGPWGMGAARPADGALGVAWPRLPLHLPWLLRQWRGRRGSAWSSLLHAMPALALTSRERVDALTAAHQLFYERHAGVFLLWTRAPKAPKDEEPPIAAAQWLGEEATRALQPALAPGWPLKAALRLPNGQVGNARLFTQGLKTQAQRLGVRFCFDTEVHALEQRGTTWHATLDPSPATPPLPSAFEAVVICAGVGSRALLRSAGLKPALGVATTYALTAPLRHVDGLGIAGPLGAVVDVQTGLVISRLGQRVRVSGLQTLGTAAQEPPAAVGRRLHAALDAAFPGCAVIREARVWQGQRLCTPDGAPLIGPTAAPGLWLNLGHGAHDWALAPGAAHGLALQLSQADAAPALQAFAPSRLL